MESQKNKYEGLAKPIKAGQIKKGMFVLLREKFALLRERPCRVTEITCALTGKHGGPKCHFYGIDIFTGKRIEDLESSKRNMYLPFVSKVYLLVVGNKFPILLIQYFKALDEEGYLTLMQDDYTTRQDLKLPEESHLQEMVERFKKDYYDEKDLEISITRSMGIEKILDYRQVQIKEEIEIRYWFMHLASESGLINLIGPNMIQEMFEMLVEQFEELEKPRDYVIDAEKS